MVRGADEDGGALRRAGEIPFCRVDARVAAPRARRAVARGVWRALVRARVRACSVGVSVRACAVASAGGACAAVVVV